MIERTCFARAMTSTSSLSTVMCRPTSPPWPTFVRSFSVAPSFADAPQANADHGSVVVPGTAPPGETMAAVTLNWVQSARTDGRMSIAPQYLPVHRHSAMPTVPCEARCHPAP